MITKKWDIGPFSLLSTILVAIAVAFVPLSGALADDIRVAPNGPTLDLLAQQEFDAWERATPGWFRDQIPHRAQFVWSSSERETVHFENEIEVIRQLLLERRDESCWFVERGTLRGKRYEVQQGVLTVVLSVTPDTQIRMLRAYDSALAAMGANTTEAMAAVPDKSIFQLLAEQTPIFGEFIALGFDLRGVANAQAKMDELYAELERFLAQYDAISRQIGEAVVTVEGGYDNGVWRLLGEDEFGSTEERKPADCSEEPWRSMSEGESRVVAEVTQALSPEDIVTLARELQRLETERDLAGILNKPSLTIDELMPRGAPRFHDPAIDPNLLLEGNWIIRWADSDEADGYAVLSRGGGLSCVGNPCRYQFARDADALWEVVFWQAGGDGNAGYVDIGGGVLNVHYYNFHLGTFGGRSIGRPVNSDEIQGVWTYADRAGTEHWTRVHSQIRWFEVYSDGVDRGTIGGDPLEVTTTYLSDNTRANRPSFRVDLYGDEMWGRHYPWVDPSTGLEIWSLSYICTPSAGGYVTHSDWRVCFNQGGVEGLSLDVRLWADAVPGLSYLYVDGIPVPIDLVIADWPG